MILPADFKEDMTSYLGQEEYTKLAEAICSVPPVSIRTNPSKFDAASIDLLTTAHRVPWCDNGHYLSERPQFTFDPLLHAGCYYVQEASSMFLSHILKHYINTPVTALDLCAAPGGKSTIALSSLPEGSVLIANEVMHQRANILAENIMKWGNPDCIVTNNHAQDFQPLGKAFDLIICDAPCSGEGMFRKDPATIAEWSRDNVEQCRRRQRDITRDIWQTLKVNGLFIYSTCTYNPHEDEENVEWIANTLGAEVLSCHPAPEWGLSEKNTHFFPHRVKGEGFFISVLRKLSDDEEDTEPPLRNKKDRHNRQNTKSHAAKMPAELREWIHDKDNYTFQEEQGTFTAFNSAHLELLQKAKAHLRVVHHGIELAVIKGKTPQPCQSLALSTALNREAFPLAEVDYDSAIAFLRTESLQLAPDTPTGHVIISYKGYPLGFAKNIGNRANNLYPSEWRIRSTYAPLKRKNK